MAMPWVLVVTLSVTVNGQPVHKEFHKELPTLGFCQREAELLKDVKARCLPRNDYLSPRPKRDIPATQQSAYPWRNP